jgi:hypothetical protein
MVRPLSRSSRFLQYRLRNQNHCRHHLCRLHHRYRYRPPLFPLQRPNRFHPVNLQRLGSPPLFYLAIATWLQSCHTRGEDAAVGQAFFPPPVSSALYDHYTHPSARRQGPFFQALCQFLHDVPSLAKRKQAYIYVYGDNKPSRHVIEKIGFRYVGSLIEDRWLFTARRYAVSAGGPFRTSSSSARTTTTETLCAL